MKKRIFAAVLACALLSGCGPVVLEDGGQTAERITVAYVPLDDRPDNLERAVYLAESLGYTLAMPETDDYRTNLSTKTAPSTETGRTSMSGSWTRRRRAVTAISSRWTNCSPADW